MSKLIVAKTTQRRTFQETYFWVFVGCLILTLVLDYFGISIEKVTEYGQNKIESTVKNVNTFITWFFPTLLLIKHEVAAWRNAYFNMQIEKAKMEITEQETDS